MQTYSSDGYVAVCANIHLDKIDVPYLSEAERVDRLQKSITSSPVIQTLWTGERLLLSGVSHGATAPVVAMAHTDYDDGPAWKGTVTTAACFLDGVYDMQATYDYFSDYPVQCKAVRDSVICNRYFGGDCGNFDGDDADFLADSTVASPASDFAIHNWKLIECGSALPGCLGDADWIPAAPITQLCTNIDAGENHNCIADPVPDEGHLTCSTGSGGAKCRGWFNALVQ